MNKKINKKMIELLDSPIKINDEDILDVVDLMMMDIVPDEVIESAVEEMQWDSFWEGDF